MGLNYFDKPIECNYLQIDVYFWAIQHSDGSL